jgi:hypothetical protein
MKPLSKTAAEIFAFVALIILLIISTFTAASDENYYN